MGLAFLLALIVFLIGSRGATGEFFEGVRRTIHDWLEETHSSGFELRRHFLRRFFDSELISDPDQAKVVAGGVLAIVLSISVIYAQAYFHKYLYLDGLPDPRLFRLSVLSDFLFLITFAMVAVALLTVLQWPSLFPGLRDYLALGGLPLKMREIFVAKFAALLIFAGIAIVAVAAPPSGVFSFTMRGRWATHLPIPGIFVAAVLAGFFVFFSLVTVQGILLNVLPVRLFDRASLALQGLLLALLLCALPLTVSIPDLMPYMDQRPPWLVYAPPMWFLGLAEVMMDNSEPVTRELSRLALGSVALAAAAAVLAYMWSYRRHRVRVIESPGGLESDAVSREWAENLGDRVVPDSRSRAVFGFIAKSLARSRQHRLILTAFGAIALAVICEGFFSLIVESRALRFGHDNAAFRQAVIAAPLALSLFLLAGLRYLFRLPVELRANWIFRMHEPGNAGALLAGAESFMLFWGVLPVAILTLPAEIAALGAASGLISALLCLLASLTLMELLLFRIERIPFTSSYFPGKDPPLITLIKYGLAVAFYVGILSTLMRAALAHAEGILIFLILLSGAWLGGRRARLGSRQFVRLEFEERADAAVQLLRIERD